MCSMSEGHCEQGGRARLRFSTWNRSMKTPRFSSPSGKYNSKQPPKSTFTNVALSFQEHFIALESPVSVQPYVAVSEDYVSAVYVPNMTTSTWINHPQIAVAENMDVTLSSKMMCTSLGNVLPNIGPVARETVNFPPHRSFMYKRKSDLQQFTPLITHVPKILQTHDERRSPTWSELMSPRRNELITPTCDQVVQSAVPETDTDDLVKSKVSEKESNCQRVREKGAISCTEALDMIKNYQSSSDEQDNDIEESTLEQLPESAGNLDLVESAQESRTANWSGKLSVGLVYYPKNSQEYRSQNPPMCRIHLF